MFKYFKDKVMVCYIYPQSLTRSRDIQVGGTVLVWAVCTTKACGSKL